MQIDVYFKQIYKLQAQLIACKVQCIHNVEANGHFALCLQNVLPLIYIFHSIISNLKNIYSSSIQ